VEVSTINAAVFAKMFLAGAKNLEAKKEWINELNVFPVPDGDTGTNMSMTIMSAAKAVSELENPTMKELAKAISSGSLRGARGNSGVILSQLFRGFTREIKKYDEINVEILSKACVKDNFLELTAEKFDLAKVLNMDDEYYEEVVWPIMYNYIRGIRYFRRNAAIAIGNSRDEKYVPDLITAAQDSDPLIREYAVWALGKIGGIEAINYLNELNKTENDSAVRAEIKLALEKNR